MFPKLARRERSSLEPLEHLLLGFTLTPHNRSILHDPTQARREQSKTASVACRPTVFHVRASMLRMCAIEKTLTVRSGASPAGSYSASPWIRRVTNLVATWRG